MDVAKALSIGHDEDILNSMNLLAEMSVLLRQKKLIPVWAFRRHQVQEVRSEEVLSFLIQRQNKKKLYFTRK